MFVYLPNTVSFQYLVVVAAAAVVVVVVVVAVVVVVVVAVVANRHRFVGRQTRGSSSPAGTVSFQNVMFVFAA